MAQATSGEIACSDWLRRVTCWSVSFGTVPVRSGFRQPFCFTTEQRGETLKSRKNLTNLVN